jgi:uncharacterized membrane protein (DUF485 family)
VARRGLKPTEGERRMAEPMTRSVAKAEPKIQKSAHEVISSPDFKQLVKRRWTVSSILLVLLFVMYYGYILLIPYAPEFMRSKIGEVTTTAIPLGVGVIIVAFVLTAIYVVWANTIYDPEVDRLKGQLRK